MKKRLLCGLLMFSLVATLLPANLGFIKPVHAASIEIDDPEVIRAIENLPVPEQITGLHVEDTTDHSIMLKWDKQSDMTEYYVELSTDLNFTKDKCTQKYYEGVLYSCENSELFDELKPGTTYYARVRSATLYSEGVGGLKYKVPHDYIKYSPYTEVLTCITAPETIVGNATQTGFTDTSVTFSWPAASGAAGYYIFEFITEKRLIATVNGTSHTVTGLTAGNSYRYLIQPFSSNGSLIETANYTTISNLLTEPPTVPTLKSVWNERTKTITLSTNTPSSYSFSGYETEFFDASNKSLSIVDSKNLSATFAGTKANTTYSYRTRGYNLTNGVKTYGPYNAKSYVISAPRTIAKKPTKRSVKLTWKKVKGATNYYVYRSTKPTSGFKRIAKLKSTKKSYTSKKLKRKRFYYYYVVAVKKANGITYTSAKTTTDKRITYIKTK